PAGEVPPSWDRRRAGANRRRAEAEHAIAGAITVLGACLGGAALAVRGVGAGEVCGAVARLRARGGLTPVHRAARHARAAIRVHGAALGAMNLRLRAAVPAPAREIADQARARVGAVRVGLAVAHEVVVALPTTERRQVEHATELTVHAVGARSTLAG